MMEMDEQVRESYLAQSEVIDWHNHAVGQQAAALACGSADSIDVARRCFEFVRDEVAHSIDCGGATLACSASVVLAQGHGYCYAKGHLLAALLRANGIPAGFDYQRLGDTTEGYALHGINTVWLEGIGWYRCDPRGNRPGLAAYFTPPRESLVWQAEGPGEIDYRLNLAEPLPEVVAALRQPLSVAELRCRLPQGIRMG